MDLSSTVKAQLNVECGEGKRKSPGGGGRGLSQEAWKPMSTE